MTDTPSDNVPTREKRPASPDGVKELLDSLVGIASTRIVVADGVVEEVHVLALPDATKEGVIQSVVSALRARFDLKVGADRIFVARIREEETPRPAPPPRPLVPPGPERHEVGPPPWPERSPDDPDDPDVLAESSPVRRSPREDGGKEESRLLFLGHRTAKRRFRAVEVAVDLQWRGRRHRGAASVQDRAPERLEAPALATLRALDAALERRPRDAHGRKVTLTLRGVEIVHALGQRHVMVSILAELGHATTPLTGTVVVDDSVELATILATLQATDRRVRAVLLNHLPGNGGPPRRT